jgi:hypothetical protein
LSPSITKPRANFFLFVDQEKKWKKEDQGRKDIKNRWRVQSCHEKINSILQFLKLFIFYFIFQIQFSYKILFLLFLILGLCVRA